LLPGLAQSKQNNHDEAIKIFSSSLSADPTNKNFEFLLLFYRGFSQQQLGNAAEAFEDYSKALKINENSPTALFQRANIHFKNNEFEECIIDCEAALKVKTSEDPKKLIEDAKTALKS
jgi:tetratricopeptide (TPR) repeat protein